LAVLGIILAAGYILWMMERALFGPPRERFADLTDASLVEIIPLVILAVTIIGVGVYPQALTEVFNQGLEPLVEVLNQVIAETGNQGTPGLAGANP
jgi:NADH-quinone oxidoreductase subunit M